MIAFRIHETGRRAFVLIVFYMVYIKIRIVGERLLFLRTKERNERKKWKKEENENKIRRHRRVRGLSTLLNITNSLTPTYNITNPNIILMHYYLLVGGGGTWFWAPWDQPPGPDPPTPGRPGPDLKLSNAIWRYLTHFDAI